MIRPASRPRRDGSGHDGTGGMAEELGGVMRGSILAGMSVTCLLVSVPSVLAGDGDRRPISGPTVITEPGRYVVTNDLSGNNGEHCVLTIASDDVDLDLGGFVVDGDEYEHCLCAADVAGIHVANGTLFIDSQDDEPTAMIYRNVSRFTVRNVTLFSTEDYLMRINGGRQGLIENSRFLRSNEFVTIGGSEITIRDSYLPKRLYLGLVNSVVANNTLALVPGDSTSTGDIWLGGTNNRVVGNKAGRLVLGQHTDGNLVQGNVFNINRYSSILVAGSRNRIFDNILSGSGEFGLHFLHSASDNTYGGNLAVDNGGVDCDVPSTIALCDEGTRNVSTGSNYLPDRR
jgi:hypothetical protein